LANRSKNNNQSRRLLSLAAVLDGMNRAAAARIGGIDRQTLRVDRRVGEASPLANEALLGFRCQRVCGIRFSDLD
jgi:hypothetical protein